MEDEMTAKNTSTPEKNVIMLKLLNESDVGEGYMTWMSDPEVTKYLESRWQSHTLDSLRSFVRTVNDGSTNFLFGIFDVKEKRHIGNIKIGPIHPIHRYGDIGLIIGEKDYWGRGIATMAISLIVEYAFAELNLHKVTASMYEPNQGSYRAFLKNGFNEIGRRKSHCFSQGEYVDLIILEKIKPEHSKT